MKICKVAVTNVFMWIAIWTPYAGIVMMAVYGDKSKITPLMAQCPSMVAKAATCFNPIVFALSHPKYGIRANIFAGPSHSQCFPFSDIVRH